MLAAGRRGVPCASYTPQQVKQAVCGTGRAAKEQVAHMVCALLRLPDEPLPDHATDALAVGVCHVNHMPLAAVLAEAGR
jgi:crossover junction endodeoxyribonuclease RuvC